MENNLSMRFAWLLDLQHGADGNQRKGGAFALPGVKQRYGLTG